MSSFQKKDEDNNVLGSAATTQATIMSTDPNTIEQNEKSITNLPTTIQTLLRFAFQSTTEPTTTETTERVTAPSTMRVVTSTTQETTTTERVTQRPTTQRPTTQRPTTQRPTTQRTTTQRPTTIRLTQRPTTVRVTDAPTTMRTTTTQSTESTQPTRITVNLPVITERPTYLFSPTTVQTISSTLKQLSEEQKKNLETLASLEKEQAAILKQLSFLTNLVTF